MAGDFDAYLARIERFTDEVLIPAESTVEAEGRISDEIVGQMRDLGLFGISIPPSYGGLGWSMEQQVRLTFAFTRASAVYRSRFSTTIGLTSQALLDYATEDQKRRYLPGMASGEITGAFCLTEPEAGSDAGAVTTTARRDGDGYVIDGRKRYITNAPDADVYLVMARTDPDTPGAAGMSALLVDRGTAGLSTGPVPDMLGQRGSSVSEVFFEGVRVRADALVGGREGGGLTAALRGINHARTHVAATCVGQADRLLAEALAHATGRRQFGKPIADFQAIQMMLAESRAELLAARTLTLDVARRFDTEDRIPVTDIACAKYYASEMVSRVADRAVQILGGAGFMENNPVTRLYRDTRLFRIFEGTSQIQLQNIARAMVREQGRA